MTKLPAEAYAIIEGRHSDPFHYLGLHQRGRPERRARLPARSVQCRGDRRTWRGGAADAHSRCRPVRRRAAERLDALPAARPLRRQRRRSRRPLPLSAGPERLRSLSARRRHPSADLRQARRASDDARRRRRRRASWCWRRTPRRVSVVGDFNFWNARRHPMRVRGVGYWELFVPACPRRRSLQVRHHRARRPASAAEIRSGGLCGGGPAHDRLDRVRRSRHCRSRARRQPASTRSARRCRSTRCISARGGARTATNG